MSEKKATKKKEVAIPKDRQELEQFVVAIRQKAESIKALAAKVNSEIAKLDTRIDLLKRNAQVEAKPIEKDINDLAQGVFLFAESHREELTCKERHKTVEFITGDKIKWYLTPRSVVVIDKEEAIKELKKRDLADFIRITEEIDKEAILRQPDKIARLNNLDISQTEIFAIVPAKMDFELQKGDRKFKKVKIEK